MLRLVLALVAVMAVVSFDAHPARANDRFPWCAVVSMGPGSVHWDCNYRTVEECVPNVLAGNRGTCNQNPRWDGWYAPVAKPRAHHRHKRHTEAH